MLSSMLKPPSKETRRRGQKNEVKASLLHEQASRLRQEDSMTMRAPCLPRLERARNLRWHLVEFSNVEEIPRLSLSSFYAGLDSAHHDLSSSPSSELNPEQLNHRRVHRPLPALESSSETTSKSSNSPRFQRTHVLDDCCEDDDSSSDSGTDSSIDSPSSIAEDVGVAWGAAIQCIKEEPALVPRSRRKVSTAKLSQSNGLNKVKPSSVISSPQEKVGRLRSAISLPTPSLKKVAHPLPLPWLVNIPPASTNSNTSSADRSEDSSRSDTISAPARTSSWPCEAVPVPNNGRWIKGALLGSGSFGKVYRGHHSETGDMCAIKEVEIVADDPRSAECAKQLAQEIALLSTLRHPNILHYKGSEMVNGERLYIYLELVSGGSIYRLLQEFNSFSEPVIRRYTRQILQGLEFLHARSTVHRDIKCANILVDQDGRIKLADFGMAKIIGRSLSTLSFKGSPHWMAPEVILQNNRGHESAIDIWSLGCTMIEMATGKPPWHKYEGCAAMFKVMNCHDVPIPDSLSPVARNFVSLCLQRDPSKRPSARVLLEHPFVQLERETSYPSQAVNNNLFQGMMKMNINNRSTCSSGMPSQFSSRNSAHQCARDHFIPQPSYQGNIPSSRSAIELSDYSKPRHVRDMRNLGRLSDTQYNKKHQADCSQPSDTYLSYKYHGIHQTQAVDKHIGGLDLQRPEFHNPRI